MKKLLPVFFIILLFAACNKQTQSELPVGKGVYIVNEGNYGFGNGEVSYYNPTTQQVTEHVFATANNFLLGDVAQSMAIKDTLGFIVVNHSSKIEVVKLPSLKHVNTITIAGSSPRYILPINDSIAYVSDLYAKRVWVINYITTAVVTWVTVPQYTEHLIQVDEFVFAEGKKIYADPLSKGSLYRIRISDHTYIDKREFNGDAEGIVKDAQNRIWILTGEDTASATVAQFTCFDKSFNQISSFAMSGFGVHPKLLNAENNTGTLWYAAGEKVYAVQNFIFPGQEVLTTTASNIYALAVEPATGDIYISDALDYVQKSRIYRYNNAGDEIFSFTAGVNSGNFTFSQ